MSADGTVYSGLQDNGELKILPDGHQYEVFGGDAPGRNRVPARAGARAIV